MDTSHAMKLERVLGFTSNNRNSFVCQPKTGNLIYIAGSIVIILDPKLKRQTHLISNSSHQITCLTLSEDGKFLATANCAPSASISIWDLDSQLLLSEFVGHKIEISCLGFSPDGQLLVSVGGKQDMNLNVWDWRRQVRLASQQLTGRLRALSFAADGSHFVGVGELGVCYWDIESSLENSRDVSEASERSTIRLTRSSASLGEHKRKSFCDVRCGRGPAAGSSYCLTKCGILCELSSRRAINKWVDLRTPNGANCLAISGQLIAIGCANGVCRCFETSELRFIRNLPKPHSLGQDLSHGVQPATPRLYPNVLALGLAVDRVALVYSDRSLYVYKHKSSATDQRVRRIFSAMYHSSCIWGLDTISRTATAAEPSCDNISASPPLGSLITCSSDDTLRVWRPPDLLSSLAGSPQAAAAAPLSSSSSCSSSGSSSPSPETINEDHASYEASKILYTDPGCSKFTSSDLDIVDGSTEDESSMNRPAQASVCKEYDSTEGLRCLRVSPCGSQLAVGSRSGSIRIYDLELESLAEIKCIAAHDSEVLCLEYSDPMNYMGLCLLASASRDKLIHIFDASNEYQFIQTIDDHLSSITALRFYATHLMSHDKQHDWPSLRMISCGADHRIIIRRGRGSGGRFTGFAGDQIVEGKSIFYDMELDERSGLVALACQDRTVRLFGLNPVGYQSSFRASLANEGTLIKIALDPWGRWLATSATDKSVSVFELRGGRRLACLKSGLADLITGLRFSPDGRRLIGCSGDGCIFIWLLCPADTNKLKLGDNLGESMVGADRSSVGDDDLWTRHAKLDSGSDKLGQRCGPLERVAVSGRATGLELASQREPSDRSTATTTIGSSLSGMFNLRSSEPIVDDPNRRLDNDNYKDDLDDDDDDEEDDEPRARGAGRRLRAERPITPPKPSPHRQIRRNSNNSASHQQQLAANRRASIELSDSNAKGAEAGSQGSPTMRQSPSKVSDLYPCDPLEMASVSGELLQRLLQDLEGLSKFALRLNQRLSRDNSPADRQLARSLLKGVKRSMDILSLVGQSTAGNSNLDSASQARPSRQRSQQEPLVGLLSRRSKSQARPSTSAALQEQQSSAGDRPTNGQLNLDQVLEAYSDRLFRMVQERMADQHHHQGLAKTLPYRTSDFAAARVDGHNQSNAKLRPSIGSHPSIEDSIRD